MKLHAMDFPYGKNHTLKKTPKVALLVTFTVVAFTVITLYYSLLGHPPFLFRASSEAPSSYEQDEEVVSVRMSTPEERCDIFTGEWVPNQEAPYYTNTTCSAIHEHQNCMKYGRPDTEYMKWRWKPDDCELPIFNPAQFLEIVRGKSLAFVGDSVARNQMQSLICLLSRVEYPEDVSPTPDEQFKRWRYTTYNFTVAIFWSPHLVRSSVADAKGPTSTGLFNLYLDEPDEAWTTQIAGFDYVVVSAGHWFFRPMVFHERRRVVGCHYCLLPDVPDVKMFFGYRRAFRAAFRAITSAKGFGGITFLRTFAPSHFENGEWNEGGNCVRRWPFRRDEAALEGTTLELYMTQMEEFRAADREARRKGLRFRVLDTTQAMLLRPDGHPSRYGHGPHENVSLYNDCVHWCLPGPIDTWNDFLLQMLKTEGLRSSAEKKTKKKLLPSSQL